MSVEILEGRHSNAVLICNTTDWAFGPVFKSAEHAEDFCTWLPMDPRTYDERGLRIMHARWRTERTDDEGELREYVGAEAGETEATA